MNVSHPARRAVAISDDQTGDCNDSLGGETQGTKCSA